MISGIALRDAMYNLDAKSGASDDYCKGLIVGLACGLTASGLSFSSAIAALAHAAPDNPRENWLENCVPATWAADFRKNL